MRPIISVENMRQSDLATINGGVPSLTLMKNAAIGIMKSTEWRGRISIVVGSGNNGGDGFALACELAEISIPCEIFSLSDKLSPDSEYYKNEALKRKIPITKLESCDINIFSDSDIIVDCIFGTGFHGEVKGLSKDVIDAVNNSQAYTISADINSGINGDTGLATTAVISDLTVSIGQLKNGFFMNNAPNYIGKLINASIGIEPEHEENYLLSKNEFVRKYIEIKSNEIFIKKLPNMPSGIQTLDDIKKISSDYDAVLYIKTLYTSFLVDSKAAWIRTPQNLIEVDSDASIFSSIQNTRI